jgi:hypothetical protein
MCNFQKYYPQAEQEGRYLMPSKRLLASILVLVILLISSLVASVAAFSVIWSQTYGGPGGEVPYSLIETVDGGYALAGDTWSYDVANGDFWLVKTDKDGNIAWNRSYGRYGGDTCYSLIQTAEGGYALAGSTNYQDMWLIKTDSNGTEEWNQTYGGPDWERAYSFVETSDGGFALAGETNNAIVVNGSFFLVKTDAFGNMEWNHTYGGELREIAYCIVESSDGGYALAGYTWSFSSAGNEDFWLVKTDANGNVEWNQTYGGTGVDIAYSLVETTDGGYAIAGQTSSYSSGDNDVLLVKTDVYGNMEWNKTYGTADFEGAYSLVQVSDGGYTLAGYTYTYILGERFEDGLLLRTDENGNMEWSRTYGNIWSNSFRSLVESSEGGYVLAGNFGDYSSPRGADFWLVKTSEYLGEVPESPSWMLPLLLTMLVIVIVLAVVYRRRIRKNNQGTEE